MNLGRLNYLEFLGPWLVAELMTDHIGMVFVHGLYLKGKWIPEPTVYVYGLFQVSFGDTSCKHIYASQHLCSFLRYSSRDPITIIALNKGHI